MARRRRTALPKITAEQAQQALHIMVQDGRIAVRDVSKALARREKLVRELRSRLSALGDDVAGAVNRAVPGKTRRALRRGARKAITEAQRTARRAQGQYLAAIRRLSKASRAKVREVRKSSGVKAAIAAAKKLAS
ncbi:MAG: hypothetical protein ACM3SU_05355 [Acidobacteriota bacterium]